MSDNTFTHDEITAAKFVLRCARTFIAKRCSYWRVNGPVKIEKSGSDTRYRVEIWDDRWKTNLWMEVLHSFLFASLMPEVEVCDILEELQRQADTGEMFQ